MVLGRVWRGAAAMIKGTTEYLPCEGQLRWGLFQEEVTAEGAG